MYDNGYGVPVDYQKAMEFYLKAAAQGNKDAQYNIGIYLPLACHILHSHSSN